MVPLAPDAAEHVLSWEDGTAPRRRPAPCPDLAPAGAVGRPSEPSGQRRAAPRGRRAVGGLRRRPSRAGRRLARRGRTGTVALLAPAFWEPAVRAAVGPVERAGIEIRFHRGLDPKSDGLPDRPRIATRRLTPGDAAAFAATAPGWALRGWGSFADLIAHGAGFGVPGGAGLAALAWILEQGRQVDLVGVYVAPRFRRLGLGRAVAAALVAHIVGERRRSPLWVHAPENAASRALGRSLGFTVAVSETLLRWRRVIHPPRDGAMPGYPIELDLAGRTALVVGLGAVGRRKAAGLVEAGARVVGVDPAAGAIAVPARGRGPGRAVPGRSSAGGRPRDRGGAGRGQPPRRRRCAGGGASGSTRRATRRRETSRSRRSGATAR